MTGDAQVDLWLLLGTYEGLQPRGVITVSHCELTQTATGNLKPTSKPLHDPKIHI